MSKPRMSAEHRRAQLMDVAQDLFARHGYARTTTAEISRAAKVTEPVLYRHFSSKLDLFCAVLSEISDEVRDHFEEIAGGHGTGAAKLLAIVRDFPHFSRDHRGLFRMADGALAEVRDDRSRALLREYYLTYESYLVDMIRQGQEDGSVRPDVDARSLTWMLIMIGIGLTLTSTLDVPALTTERKPGELARLVEAIVLRR